MSRSCWRLLCGLRRGEIAALRWRCIDLVNGHLVQSSEQTVLGYDTRDRIGHVLTRGDLLSRYRGTPET